MDQVVLWAEGNWRCELHAWTSERALLKIFLGEERVILEPVFVGESAFRRAKVLRSVFCRHPKTTSMD